MTALTSATVASLTTLERRGPFERRVMISSRISRRRQDIRPPDSSRAFVDEALGALAAARWAPTAWLHLFSQSALRSWKEAQQHRDASCELLAEHIALIAIRPRAWPCCSWLLAATHVGMLGGPGAGLGWPNRLSLLRANIPAVAHPPAPWWALVALATDWADGRLARRGRATAFGAYADGFADIAFWCWYVRHHEPNRAIRRVGIAMWAGPAAAATVAFFACGRAVNVPRLAVVRDVSVAVQLLVTGRAVARSVRGHRAT